MITTTTNIIAITNTDMNRANYMMAKTDGTINPLLMGAKLAMISELKKRFAKGEVVEFDYLKKSTGEIRHAIGCLYGSLIEPKIKGTGVHNSIYGNITYFDLQRNQFRCFSVETLIKVY